MGLVSDLLSSLPPATYQRGGGESLTGRRDVEALRRLAELVDGLDGLVVELDLLEVLADARRGDGFWDDAVAADLGPGEDDLGGGDGLALDLGQAVGDGLDLGDGDQQRQAERVVAERRVGGDEDVLLGAVLDQRVVGDARVALDLVDGGHDAGGFDDVLELVGARARILVSMIRSVQVSGFGKTYVLNGEVGNADCADLALGQLIHGYCNSMVSGMQQI